MSPAFTAAAWQKAAAFWGMQDPPYAWRASQRTIEKKQEKSDQCTRNCQPSPPFRSLPRENPRRLLKNDPLLHCPRPSSFNVQSQYASLLGPSGALHPAIFEQPFGEPFWLSGAHPVRIRNHDGCFLNGEQAQVASPIFAPTGFCSDHLLNMRLSGILDSEIRRVFGNRSSRSDTFAAQTA